jgi:hypothetical protein
VQQLAIRLNGGVVVDASDANGEMRLREWRWRWWLAINDAL